MALSPDMIDAMLAATFTAEEFAAALKAQMAVDVVEARAVGPVSITPAVRQAVIARDGFVCTYCGDDVLVPNLDHVFPKSRGGPSTPDNLVVSCRSCNCAKKDRTPEEWRS